MGKLSTLNKHSIKYMRYEKIGCKIDSKESKEKNKGQLNYVTLGVNELNCSVGTRRRHVSNIITANYNLVNKSANVCYLTTKSY